jgi:hypothetical protein
MSYPTSAKAGSDEPMSSRAEPAAPPHSPANDSSQASRRDANASRETGDKPLSLHDADKEAALDNVVAPVEAEALDDLEDGSFYGWVVVVCIMLQSTAIWGMNTTFGIYLSYYSSNDTFPGTSQSSYAFVGGLTLGCCFLIAPFSNYATARFGYKPVGRCVKWSLREH